MPYFPDLQELLNEFNAWADLRHEQALDAAAVAKELRRQLRIALSEVKRMKPGKAALAKEPNTLKAIKALRPKGPRRLWQTLDTRGLRKRMKGAWLGRAAGCTLGAPVENWTITDMERLAGRFSDDFPPTNYWRGHPTPDVERYGASTLRDYLRDGMRETPVDDDLTYTVLGLLILEEYGLDFTTDDVGEAWVKYLPVACTAEQVALESLKVGVPAAKAGERNNPYQEWIGADIRSDPWGYAAPGWPERAAEMAYRDAYLSHRQNGLYGAMYFSAAIAAAFAVDDPMEALAIGLTEIPKTCRLARDLRWALKTAPQLKDWREARQLVDARFKGMHSVHTNNNACLTVFGLSLGQKDFTKTIGITVAMGLDNDCTAATAGSLLGAVIGIDRIPAHWWKPFRNKTRTYLTGHPHWKNSDIVNRFVNLARRGYGE